jgi:hypothetical protein
MNTQTVMFDTGSHCIECLRSTHFGSGLFVNRIPADDGQLSGWLCPECQSIGCAECGQPSIDYGFSAKHDGFVCDECAEKEVALYRSRIAYAIDTGQSVDPDDIDALRAMGGDL